MDRSHALIAGLGAALAALTLAASGGAAAHHLRVLGGRVRTPAERVP